MGWVFFLFFASTSALAFEWIPEHHSLSEDEEALVDSPGLYEEEYDSDALTYTKPLEWESDWVRQNVAVDAAVGSVSAKHFIVENRAKIHKPLNDFFALHFTYLEEREYETTGAHHVFELKSVLPMGAFAFGAGLYGEPHFYKRNDDTGIALYLRLPKWVILGRNEIKFFNTFVDVTRLKRNDRTDTYERPYEPHSRGAVARGWTEEKSPDGLHDFWGASYRQDTPTRWIFPTQSYRYEYKRKSVSLWSGHHVQGLGRLLSRMQLDDKYESKAPTSGTSTTPHEAWRLKRIKVLIQNVFWDIQWPVRFHFRPGLYYVWRDWRSNLGGVRQRDLLPHAWFDFPVFGTGSHADLIKVGFDLHWHQSDGQRGVRNPRDADRALNSRFNLGYQFTFSDAGKFMLIAAADIDELGTRESWEGGSAQLQLKF